MIAVIVAAAALAVLCWPRRVLARTRVRGLVISGPADVTTDAGIRLPVLAVGGLAVAGAWLAGVAWWLVAVLAVAGVAGARLKPRAGPTVDEVPLAADLMAACLFAGATPLAALTAAAGAAGPWIRGRAEPVLRELGAGALPEQAWAGWLTDPRLAVVARTCARAGGSGAAVGAELTRAAARMRARQRALVQERVARASVWVVLPLGLCFLPAFVVAGVVPLVLSLLSSLR